MNDPFDPPRARAPHRGRRRLLRVAIAVGTLLTVSVAGAGVYVWRSVNADFNKTKDRSIKVDPKPRSGEPMNILVLGSDRRDVIDPEDRDRRQYAGGSGRRADTIILVHVAADGKHAVLVHFPRDLRVNVPGRGIGKINGAYTGGPNLVVRTVKAYTGLPIHHYVEVNFASFRRIVEAVGGIEIYVNRTYDDPQSGLKIDKPGCIQMDGDLALAYARMRKQDPRGDFGRIERQQRFMRALTGKITSIGFLLDLPRVLRLSDAISTGVVTDQGLSLGLVRQVANRLSGFNQSLLDFRVVPSYADYVGGVAYVIDRRNEAKALFSAIKADAELPPFGKTPLSVPEPSDVSVKVLNGAGVDGLASKTAEKLRKIGFVVRGAATAPARAGITTILFQPGTELKANLLAKRFPGAQLRVAPEPFPTDVQVVLGADAAATPSPGTSPAAKPPAKPPAERCG